MGHGVTGTTASNPKFLNKPGEVFPGTDLPIPLNPNLVDPELLNLPPLPGTIDEITAVKYHHQDPQWLYQLINQLPYRLLVLKPFYQL